MLATARPNAAHLALAELERRGLVRAVITQNIDLLHERAGSPRARRGARLDPHLELPPAAAHVEPLEGVLELLRDAPAPACRDCGTILKPDVVMFGELLPPEAIDRAFELAREAALLVVVGSSLEVHPVAGLPGETLAAGGRLAILNRGRTPYDTQAALAVDGSAGEVLSAVVEALA